MFSNSSEEEESAYYSFACTIASAFSNGGENVHLTLINDPTNISQALVADGAGGYNDYWAGRDFAFRLEDGVIATPLPAAVWLFGTGLLGMAGMARRKQS